MTAQSAARAPLRLAFTKFRPRFTFASALFALGLSVSFPAKALLQTFELDAPNAKQVYLAGEMTNWDANKQAMKKDATGKWHITVDLGQGQWLYKFVVDGQWITDPATALHDNDGQGGQHSFVFVGDGAWSEHAEIAHGKVETLMLPSKSWGKSIKTNVYFPPDFKSGQAYPVLLLLHGSGMDADQWLKTGMINRYMDNLLAQKTIQPFVIVMPSSEKLNYVDESERFITQELPVWLNNTYGLKPGPKRFAVAGMSMGGFGAFHLPSEHPDLFGFGFGLSGFYPTPYINALPKRNPLPFKFMMLCGSDDGLVSSNQNLARVLKSHGTPFYYRENPGAHAFQYWSNHTVEMLTAVNHFFAGDELAHNDAEINLPEPEPTNIVEIPTMGKEIAFTKDQFPRLVGVWQGEWVLAGGLKGKFEQTITEFSGDQEAGLSSVYDAGPDTIFDAPYAVKFRIENGRQHYADPKNGTDTVTVLSEQDNALWRQWYVNSNGLDVLLRVKKIDKPSK